MSFKGGQTQGYRYYLSLLTGLSRGPINEVVEIRISDKVAWNGHACSGQPQQIDAPNLFGGEDKEGGVQGPFTVFMGADDQVLPGAQGSLPDVRASIGGRVSQLRGVATLWFDGMVSAMTPYLKTWKFRLRRATAGWDQGVCWYPEKATIYLGGSSVNLSTNRPNDFPITTDSDAQTVTISIPRNVQDKDSFTVNGITLTIVKKQSGQEPQDFEMTPAKNAERSIRAIANYFNSRSTVFKVTATYTNNSITISANKALQDIYAMNPAHIVFQCFTDPLWGRGLAWNQLNDNSFTYAANLFCSEGFGLALIWYRKEDIDVFIQKICDLAGMSTYTDRETGLITVKPIRADYVLADLPLFTPETGLLNITDDDSGSADNAYNEVIGTSRDPITNLDFQVRAQNPAARMAQGAVSSLDQDYKGIPTKELLQRVVLRDLRAMSSGLKKYSIVLDRRGWRVAPGSVIRISHPLRGLTNVVIRVTEIDDGDMVNGQIRIKGAIDVFGLPATGYQDVVESGWAAPSRLAVPALDERLTEVGYRTFYITKGPADAAAVPPGTAYIGQVAIAPNSTTLDYSLATRPEGDPDYVERAVGSFTGNAVLTDDITELQTDIFVSQRSMFAAENVGQVLLIDDELVRLDSLNEATGAAVITRGVADTIPEPHEADAVLWTIDDDLVSDGVPYAAGETVYAKVLSRTSSDILDIDQADEQSVVLSGRIARPYPPANVKQSGVSIFSTRASDLPFVLTWDTRNRITQADHIVGHTEASVAPEDGTTYTLRLYKSDGTLVRTVAGLADTTWTYSPEMIAADNVGNRVVVELESVRDGLTSWQHYRFAVTLKGGWGFGWGFGWGA